MTDDYKGETHTYIGECGHELILEKPEYSKKNMEVPEVLNVRCFFCRKMMIFKLKDENGN